MKTDDDTMISTDLLLQYLDNDLPIAPYNTGIYGGSVVWSWKQQTLYGTGHFYMMSTDLAEWIEFGLTSERRKKLMDAECHTEDLDMGSFVYSYPG
jgi:hypothetical protein